MNANQKFEDGIRLLREAVAELTDDPWIDQHHSPLGHEQHLRAVRSGALRGHKVKRRVLVRRSEIDKHIEARVAHPSRPRGKK